MLHQFIGPATPRAIQVARRMRLAIAALLVLVVVSAGCEGDSEPAGITGARVSPDGQFQWDSLDEAQDYVVVIAADSGPVFIERASAPSLSWVPPVEVDGPLKWAVFALSEDQLVGTSSALQIVCDQVCRPL